MNDPFASALVALHAAPGSMAAVYTPFGGAPLPDPIRVIREQKTADVSWGDTTAPSATTTFSIMATDVPEPKAGDRLTIGTETLAIVGEPRLDAEGLSWSVEAPPA